jgi:hypothetical protein
VKHKGTIRFLLSDFDTVSVPCRLPAIDMIQNGHTIFHRIVFSLGMIDETAIGERYRALAGELDERRRRLWAAAARATGMAGA